MDISLTYKKILDDINQGHRGLVRLSESEIEFLALELENQNRLLEVLCILEHSSHSHPVFEASLIKLLNSQLEVELLVFTLTCSRKHIVDARMQCGKRLEFEFLETLKKLLFHSSPEVVEWTLRLIEGCGNQGIYFLKEFDKIKPPPWKWFNVHQRAVREIIALLERRWSPIEKSQPRSK